jgi:NTE family protein
MATGGRALVLGGGGVTGIAWETGILAGLAEARVDLTSADLVVGTSAGAVVGAQILSGLPLEDLYAAQLKDATRGVVHVLGEIATRMSVGLFLRIVPTLLWPGDGQRGRARLGRAALKAHTIPELQMRAVYAEWLSSRDWPERRLLITAVDTETGAGRAFDRGSGAPLLDAVAASCAFPLVSPPISIKGRRYMDGGMLSTANANLAAGCERVVVLAPVTMAFRPSSRIVNQLAALGPNVRSVVISADAQARKAMGRNALDSARRAASARAGRAQAANAVEAVAAVWSAA